MARRISFHTEILKIDRVAQKHEDTAKSLRFYYNEPGLELRDAKFVGYSRADVQQELNERLDELDRDSAFGIFGSLEASFRMDYLERCYERRKDDLSRHFRKLFKRKGNRASLGEDIFEAWKHYAPQAKGVIADIIGAFHYRDWLAHGRYWVPKLGRPYDFLTLYLLAQSMQPVFDGQGR